MTSRNEVEKKRSWKRRLNQTKKRVKKKKMTKRKNLMRQKSRITVKKRRNYGTKTLKMKRTKYEEDTEQEKMILRGKKWGKGRGRWKYGSRKRKRTRIRKTRKKKEG